jgi:hypothetical protein
MFYASCKSCDRVLAFSDADLHTALRCPQGHESIPNRVGAVDAAHGPDVVQWVDKHPGCTGADLAAQFGERSLEDERAARVLPAEQDVRALVDGDEPRPYERPRMELVGNLRNTNPKDTLPDTEPTKKTRKR